nr:MULTISPECIES: JAB domain-containing protein [Bacteroidota]
MTEKIKKVAQLLDVKVLDYIIMAPDGTYLNFADEGIL